MIRLNQRVREALVVVALAASLIMQPARGQQTITYLNGDDNLTDIAITGTLNPTTLTISTGSATQTGTISESGTVGSIIKEGGGTLLLNGLNSYTGTTTINAGVLALGDGGDIESSRSVNLTAAGATFDISTSNVGVTIQDLSGVAGSFVQLDGNLLSAGTANSTTFAGVLEDVTMGEFLKQGTGTLTLTGTNNYHCSTFVSEGTLALGVGGSVAASCEVFIYDAATFDISGGGNQTIQDVTALDGSTINLGANTLTAGTANTYDIISGVVEGTGGLTKQGSGSLDIASVTAYTGATTILDGTLVIDTGASVASSSGVNLAANGTTLDISGGGNQTIKDLSGVAGSTIVLGGNTLTTGTSNSTGFGGSIQGTGGLTKQGSGTLTLSGSSTYTGATHVVVGQLLVTNTTGSATGDGALTVDSGATIGGTGIINSTSNTINGNVQVGAGGSDTTGILTLTASGTTTFSGANLTFNLDALSTASNELDVESTPSVLFGSGVTTLTLNLVGSESADIASGTDYILFTATSASQYADLTISGGRITNFTLNFIGNATNGELNSVYYGRSFLFLNGNNIEVEIVPEPGTWVLLLGGLGLLVLGRRKKLA